MGACAATNAVALTSVISASVARVCFLIGTILPRSGDEDQQRLNGNRPTAVLGLQCRRADTRAGTQDPECETWRDRGRVHIVEWRMPEAYLGEFEQVVLL